MIKGLFVPVVDNQKFLESLQAHEHMRVSYTVGLP